MFIRKAILLLLIACSATSHSNALSANQYLVGNITQQASKDFLVGLSIGLCHGLINNTIHAKCTNAGMATDFFTYIAASTLEHSYDTTGNIATLWGRAVGQCFAESINLYNEKNKCHFVWNLTMVAALLNTFFPTKMVQFEVSDGEIVVINWSNSGTEIVSVIRQEPF